jgi:SAM-dependent methyltransferase
MLVSLIRNSTSRYPFIRRLFWGRLYDFIVRRIPLATWTFMNYGYIDEELNPDRFALDASEEPNRYPIQLYEKLARAADWDGAKALEIGSGRGGGCRYLMTRHAPHSMVGVDLSRDQIAFCRRHHAVPGLSFFAGDAEALPFGAESFDIVVNVESSHCYTSMRRFLDEVTRVLKPGGTLLWADLRFSEEIPEVLAAFSTSTLEPLFEEEITERVVAALDATSAAKQKLIREHVPFYARDAFHAFAGVPGAPPCENLRSGRSTYRAGAYRKPR